MNIEFKNQVAALSSFFVDMFGYGDYDEYVMRVDDDSKNPEIAAVIKSVDEDMDIKLVPGNIQAKDAVNMEFDGARESSLFNPRKIVDGDFSTWRPRDPIKERRVIRNDAIVDLVRDGEGGFLCEAQMIRSEHGTYLSARPVMINRGVESVVRSSRKVNGKYPVKGTKDYPPLSGDIPMSRLKMTSNIRRAKVGDHHNITHGDHGLGFRRVKCEEQEQTRTRHDLFKQYIDDQLALAGILAVTVNPVPGPGEF